MSLVIFGFVMPLTLSVAATQKLNCLDCPSFLETIDSPQIHIFCISNIRQETRASLLPSEPQCSYQDHFSVSAPPAIPHALSTTP